MSEKSYNIPGPLIVVVLSTLLTGAVGFNAWAVAAVYDRPTELRVKELVLDKSPYRTDRAMILKVLEDVRESNERLRESITEHTKVIAELKAKIN